MQLIIGLVGEQSGGKGTFTKLFQEVLNGSRTITKIGSGDLLLETLNLWDISNTRVNFQKLVVAMEQTYGEGSVTKAVRKRIESCDSEIIIIDSIRLPTDLEMLRSFPINLLVYITAAQEKRYERIRTRKEKTGEEFAMFEQFQLEEQAATEIYIPIIGTNADFRIDNNSDLNYYHEQVREFCNRFV